MRSEQSPNRFLNATTGISDFVHFNRQMYKDHMYALSIVGDLSTGKELNATWSRWETIGVSSITQALGMSLKDASRAPDFLNVYFAFTKLWQALDEGLDDGVEIPTGMEGVAMGDIKKFNAAISVRPGDKDTNPTFATFSQIQTAFINSLCASLPDEGETRKKVLKLAASYLMSTIQFTNEARQFVDEAIPEVMPFERSKNLAMLVTGNLVSKAFEVFGIINNVPEEQIKILRDFAIPAGVAMQFGDDLQDWRRDVFKHRKKQKGESNGYQRPIENLFIGLLKESPAEYESLMAHIDDNVPAHRRGNVFITEAYFLARKYALNTLAQFHELFEDELANIPEFPHRRELITQWRTSFYKIIPITEDFTMTRPWLEKLIAYLVKKER